MSMPTSRPTAVTAAARARPMARRLALLLPAALALAACAEGVGFSAPDRTRVTIAGAPVTIAAPAGFCIDDASTTNSERGAFVLVSDCALLGRPNGDAPPVGAVLTASVSANPALVAEGGETTLDDLEAFLDTPRGRAVLGRSGDAQRTRTLQTTRRGDILYVLVEDRGQQPLPGVEPRFWRAFMTVNGRMAALSIQGFEGASPGPEGALNTLAAFAASIRAANPRA
jgi:hypothetical protein